MGGAGGAQPWVHTAVLRPSVPGLGWGQELGPPPLTGTTKGNSRGEGAVGGGLPGGGDSLSWVLGEGQGSPVPGSEDGKGKHCLLDWGPVSGGAGRRASGGSQQGQVTSAKLRP